MTNISIGELARRCEVKVPTIRYYEQVGLLPSPVRTDGRQRRYSQDAIARLDFIRHARALGFEMPAVRELLTLSTQPDRPCSEVDGIARRHVDDIDRRIAELRRLRGVLMRSLETCGQGRVGDCGVIGTLVTHPIAQGRDSL